MRENGKSLKQSLRIIEHRTMRPRVWRAFIEQSVASLSDEGFLLLFRFAGPSQEFIDHFHSAARFRFFFHPRNQKDFFLQLLTQSQSYESILEDADDVLQDKFQTLGSVKVSLGEHINWQQDFKSGIEWPPKPSWELDYLDLDRPSDVKVPWELSRFHQVWWLGKAYWLTRNEKYAEKFKELIEDWIEQNPPGQGVNWLLAMEAAIRASNWIAGYYLFCESKSLSSEFWLKFWKSLYVHGVFIRNNLEYSWRNGNHFLSNVTGLVFLGLFFQETRAGKAWMHWGVASLEEEMRRQVSADGVNYEKSTSYHRLVLELFYTPAILCLKNNIKLSSSLMSRLEKMFEFIQHYTRPDGSTPLIGDADDGRLFRFSMTENVNDHRHALSVGAILFERNDFKTSAGKFSQDALWLLGGEGFEKHQLLRGDAVPLASRSFPKGGFYILLSSDAHLFVDAGDIGMEGRGGHGHNDTLSFELWAHGHPLIVDSGTYAYTFDIAARNEFRSTRAHNTIMIDGREIAEFATLWSVKEDNTDPRVSEWKTTDELDVLEAEHSGYQSLPVPVVHRRRIGLKKKDFRVTITDRLAGNGTHQVESFLHFAPAVRLELRDAKTAVAINGNRKYIISVSGGELQIVETWFSPSYGIRVPNKTLKLHLIQQLPLTITTSIGIETP